MFMLFVEVAYYFVYRFDVSETVGVAFEYFFKLDDFAFCHKAHKRLFSGVRVWSVTAETGRSVYKVFGVVFFDRAYVIGDDEELIRRFAALYDFIAYNVAYEFAKHAHAHRFIIERSRIGGEYETGYYRYRGVYRKGDVKEVKSRVSFVYEPWNNVDAAARTVFPEQYSVCESRDYAR